jgi:aquaporin Z
MNKYVAEFLGTIFFLYVILATGKPIPIGLALMAAILVLGKFSGGNFNPAVSVMMVAAGKLPAADLLPYIVAQISGALVALELYKLVKL